MIIVYNETLPVFVPSPRRTSPISVNYAQELEPLRQHVGKPVVITSGYRCKALNKSVGGVATSQHLTGEAADIHINSLSEGREWFTWIMDNCSFDQLIWEYGWIHVSCRRDLSKNRQQVIEYGRVK